MTEQLATQAVKKLHIVKVCARCHKTLHDADPKAYLCPDCEVRQDEELLESLSYADLITDLRNGSW